MLMRSADALDGATLGILKNATGIVGGKPSCGHC